MNVIGNASIPPVIRTFANSTVGHGSIQLQPQSMIEIGNSQSIQNKQPHNIYGKQKRYVQPNLFAVKILIQPEKDMIFA